MGQRQMRNVSCILVCQVDESAWKMAIMPTQQLGNWASMVEVAGPKSLTGSVIRRCAIVIGSLGGRVRAYRFPK